MEKCYRDIQSRGLIGGLNMLELFILIAIPLVLFPIFTLFGLNTLIIFVLDVILFVVFRLANKVSSFDYGMVSFIYSKFVWPQKLSAYRLDEKQYLKDEPEQNSKIKS